MRLSEREERVLAVLKAQKRPSTKEIEDLAIVASARDYVRHLRDKGFQIKTHDLRTDDGVRIVRYELLAAEPVPAGNLF